MEIKLRIITIIIIVFFLLIILFPGWSEFLPMPGEELTLSSEYPEEGMCGEKEVINYGLPSYHLDQNMEHMNSLKCANSMQCNEWKPESYKGDETLFCCMNEGFCYIEKEVN